MRVSSWLLVLFGVLSGVVPVTWHFYARASVGPLVPVPWCPLVIPLVGALLLTAHVYLFERSEEQETRGRVAGPLWAVLVIMLSTAIFTVAWIGRFKNVDPHLDEWIGLVPGVMALAVVSVSQSLLAG